MAENGDAPMPPAPESAPPQPINQEPNQTLYIKNIDESLSRKHRLEELKGKIKNLFRPYGEILDIVALSNFYDKGQVFVVFKTVEMAQKAMAELQGHVMSGKEMRIFYAKSKSDAVAKLEGTYKPREKRIRPKPQSGPKPAFTAPDTAMPDSQDAPAAPPPQQQLPPAAPAGYPPGPPPNMGGPPYGGPPPPFSHGPPPPHAQPPMQQPPMQQPPMQAPVPAGPTMPHPILFLENLPLDATNEAVSAVFSPFPGFKEVRLVPSRPGIAFCEFDNEMQSGMALQRLQGYKMEDNALKISFSKS